jgi:hypothetical protein
MLYESEEVDILMTRRGERAGVGREGELAERAEMVLASPMEVVEVFGVVVEGEQARYLPMRGSKGGGAGRWTSVLFGGC